MDEYQHTPLFQSEKSYRTSKYFGYLRTLLIMSRLEASRLPDSKNLSDLLDVIEIVLGKMENQIIEYLEKIDQ